LERRKWIDCFVSVDSVTFVAALSEFDESMTEAKHTNHHTHKLLLHMLFRHDLFDFYLLLYHISSTIMSLIAYSTTLFGFLTQFDF